MNESSKNKVMLFGSFDVLHEGHFYLFEKSQKYGNLIVAVAPDKVVELMKKRKPEQTILKRVAHLKKYFAENNFDFVKVIIGDDKNSSWHVVEKYKPDIIVVGYDQIGLMKALKTIQEKYHFNLIQLDAFKPGIYKSSIIKTKRKA